VQAVLQAFKKAEKKIEEGGMRKLLVYWPLLSKYDLPTLEVGEQYCNLSKQLAKKWLSSYMLNCEEDDERVVECATFFSDYETHKSHGRSISRKEATSKHLNVRELEHYGFYDLVKSLHIQYVFMFDKSPFVKFFENSHGIHWGWKAPPPPEKK
ncbi:MAG: hypothetical protein WBZ42_04810, partial [Halobacteriota archaeon]